MSILSVIVLTYNSQEYIEKCLRSVVAQDFGELDIIVVDNGSQDKTLDIIKSLGSGIKVIENSENLGVAKARNQGIRESSGKYILFLDDDAYLDRDCLSLLVCYMEENIKVGLAGPKILYPDGSLQYSCRRFPTPLSVVFRGTFLGRKFPKHPGISAYLMKDFDHKSIGSVDWVLGACQIIRRDVFNTGGLLDENYFFGYEDIELCLRLKRRGLLVKYFPKALVYHYYRRRSAVGLISRNKLSHIKSIARFFIKKYFTI